MCSHTSELDQKQVDGLKLDFPLLFVFKQQFSWLSQRRCETSFSTCGSAGCARLSSVAPCLWARGPPSVPPGSRPRTGGGGRAGSGGRGAPGGDAAGPARPQPGSRPRVPPTSRPRLSLPPAPGPRARVVGAGRPARLLRPAPRWGRAARAAPGGGGGGGGSRREEELPEEETSAAVAPALGEEAEPGRRRVRVSGARGGEAGSGLGGRFPSLRGPGLRPRGSPALGARGADRTRAEPGSGSGRAPGPAPPRPVRERPEACAPAGLRSPTPRPPRPPRVRPRPPPLLPRTSPGRGRGPARPVRRPGPAPLGGPASVPARTIPPPGPGWGSGGAGRPPARGHVLGPPWGPGPRSAPGATAPLVSKLPAAARRGRPPRAPAQACFPSWQLQVRQAPRRGPAPRTWAGSLCAVDRWDLGCPSPAGPVAEVGDAGLSPGLVSRRC